MADIYYHDKLEKERTALFIYEQKEAWGRAEAIKVRNAELNGTTYEPQPAPEITEERALQEVRAGWKSQLDKLFEKKRRREEAQGIKWGSGGARDF